MPGVVVTTNTRSGAAGVGNVPAGQFFVLGEAERGPLDAPVLCRSLADYTYNFGGYKTGNLYPHVNLFFAEGGQRCWVQRLISDSGSPAKAARSYYVTVASGSGTTEVLTASAANEGAWGNDLKVEVIDADTSNSTNFKIRVSYDGEVLLTTRDLTSLQDAITVIASSSVAHLVELSYGAGWTSGSTYSSSFRPKNSATGSSFQSAVDPKLAGGANGSALDADDLSTGLGKVSEDLGTGAISAPTYTATSTLTAVNNALRDHASTTNRVAFIAGAEAHDTKAEIIGVADDYYSDEKARYMALFWPYIEVADPSNTTNTNTRIKISPVCYAAASRARAVVGAGGPWRPGAGSISTSNSIKKLVTVASSKDANDLDDARVNVIRQIGNTFQVYGARSLSANETHWRYITHQDTINYIVDNINRRLEPMVFSNIDGSGKLFSIIRTSISSFLDGVAAANGIYRATDEAGAQLDNGYRVVVDRSNNPLANLQQGRIAVDVGLRVAGVADLYQVTITKSNLSSTSLG